MTARRAEDQNDLAALIQAGTKALEEPEPDLTRAELKLCQAWDLAKRLDDTAKLEDLALLVEVDEASGICQLSGSS